MRTIVEDAKSIVLSSVVNSSCWRSKLLSCSHQFCGSRIAGSCFQIRDNACQLGAPHFIAGSPEEAVHLSTLRVALAVIDANLADANGNNHPDILPIVSLLEP